MDFERVITTQKKDILVAGSQKENSRIFYNSISEVYNEAFHTQERESKLAKTIIPIIEQHRNLIGNSKSELLVLAVARGLKL